MAELCPRLPADISLFIPTVPSALQGAGSQTEPPVGFPHLLLVSGLDQTEHHSCQRHASCCPPPHAAICPSVGRLAAHGADEIGAHFPLSLAHLGQQQYIHAPNNNTKQATSSLLLDPSVVSLHP